MSNPTDKILTPEEEDVFKQKFPSALITCKDEDLPEYVKNRIRQLERFGKICQKIEVREGNVFEITTKQNNNLNQIERFVIQPQAESGGKKTRKRNRKHKHKKKHVRKTNRARKVKK